MSGTDESRKEGFYYTFDALLSSALLLGVILLVINTGFTQDDVELRDYTTEDITNILSEMRVSELNDTQQAEIRDVTNMSNDTSIIRGLTELWALNESDTASDIFESLVKDQVPDEIETRLSIEDEEIYATTSNVSSDVYTRSRMISGVEYDKPTEGASASAYLKQLRDKVDSEFTYFGGFVGQGNISHRIRLPSDYNSSRYIESELKVETPGRFDLYVNGQLCLNDQQGQEGVVSDWDLSPCQTAFTSGENTVRFAFDDALNQSYIAGGYLRVDYTTDELLQADNSNVKRYHFPNVEGFVNIFDSLSAQGSIKNLEININVNSDYDMFLNVGNETILQIPGLNTTQNIQVDEAVKLPPTQTPLRFGLSNVSEVDEIQQGQPADTALLTDTSGSMNQCVVYTEEEHCSYEYQWWFWWYETDCPYEGSCQADECNTGSSNTRNHEVINKSVCEETQLDIAQESAKSFSGNILNSSLSHKIGLSDFESDANSYLNLTNIESELRDEIDTYTAGGNTCTCCALNRGRKLIENSDNERFMVVLGDGEPNYYCGDLNETTGQGYDETQAIQDTYDSSDYACNNNISVYTVGFGETMSDDGQDIMENTACEPDMYYDASNVSDLESIYDNITQQILLEANYTGQTVEVTGDINNTVINNSYIDMEYDPFESQDLQNKISVAFEESNFTHTGCEANVNIPQGVDVMDAKVASFSSNNWTKSLKITNSERTDFVVYNLTQYGNEYRELGDPFQIQVPSEAIESGETNTLELDVGSTPMNSTTCSEENTFIYTALINSTTPRTEVKEYSEGCTWEVEFEDGSTHFIDVPQGYNGSDTCEYTSDGVAYDVNDTLDVAMYDLLQQLDFRNNQKVFVNIQDFDLEVVTTVVENIPYLWGPVKAVLEVW